MRALCVILHGGGPVVGSAAILQRTTCRLFAMLFQPVVCCIRANLHYRPSTFLVVRTSPLLPRAMVATCLCQISLSVSGPSAMRRALGQSRWGSLWWSSPPPGRGRGTGWERNPFGAQRELGVYRWMTPPMGEIPAPSGAAAMTPCIRATIRWCDRIMYNVQWVRRTTYNSKT